MSFPGCSNTYGLNIEFVTFKGDIQLLLVKQLSFFIMFFFTYQVLNLSQLKIFFFGYKII